MRNCLSAFRSNKRKKKKVLSKNKKFSRAIFNKRELGILSEVDEEVFLIITKSFHQIILLVIAALFPRGMFNVFNIYLLLVDAFNLTISYLAMTFTVFTRNQTNSFLGPN